LLCFNRLAEGELSSAEELIEQAHSIIHTAKIFADLAIGLTPFVGATKDLYEAFSGVNPITGEILTLNERIFATTLGVLSFGKGRLSKILLQGPLKLLRKFGKLARLTKTVGQTHRVEKVVRRTEKILDSAGEIKKFGP
jgi:hypothetical protein